MQPITIKSSQWRTISLAFVLFCSLFLISISVVPLQTTSARQCDQSWYDGWLSWYGQSSPPAPSTFDLNGDGKVNGQDYVIWLNNYGSEFCPGIAPPVEPTVDTIATAQVVNADFPDVRAYCRSIGYQDIQVTGSLDNVYSVYCVRNDTEIASFDMNTVCQSLYGADASAEITNTDSPYGWDCSTNNASPQQVNTNDVTKVPVPVIVGNPNPTGTFTVKATANNVNVRTGPGTENQVIGQISPENGYFESIGASNGWLHIKFAGGEGWVSIDYVRPPDLDSPVPTIAPTQQTLPVAFTPQPSLPLCPSGTGPDGITAGGYDPTKLTQAQRQWLFERFGHSGEAPVGYGGESCASQTSQIRVCPTNATGPGGITAGGYDPTILTQVQRQWLFEQFGHTGEAPVGYGGETCTGSQLTVRACPSGVGEPGSFDPTTLTQQQRNELFHAFGHTGEAPVGYGGEACTGGQMNLASFIQNTSLVTSTPYSGTNLPIEYGSTNPVGNITGQVISSEKLNIRSEATLNSPVIALATSGAYFEVLEGPVNGWYAILLQNGRVGWVSGDWFIVNTVVEAPNSGQCQLSNQRGWVWVSYSRFNALLSQAQTTRDELAYLETAHEWASGKTVDKITEDLIKELLRIKGERNFTAGFIANVVSIGANYLWGSQADTLRNLNIYRNLVVQLEMAWNNENTRKDGCVLLNWNYAELPLIEFPLFWHIWSDWIPLPR